MIRNVVDIIDVHGIVTQQKEARARQKARRHRHKTGEVLRNEYGDEVEEGAEAEEEQVNNDQRVLDEPDIAKPEKPESSFGPEAREKIIAKFQEIRRQPGDSTFNVYMIISYMQVHV